MGVSIIKFAVKLAGILSSFTLFAVGSIVLLRAMSLDFDTVLYALKYAFLSSIIAGFLGYSIGKIFDSPHKNHEKLMKTNKKADLLIDDILVNDLDQVSSDVDS